MWPVTSVVVLVTSAEFLWQLAINRGSKGKVIDRRYAKFWKEGIGLLEDTSKTIVSSNPSLPPTRCPGPMLLNLSVWKGSGVSNVAEPLLVD